MPRYFAVDTRNNNAVSYIGATDKDTGEWIERDDELLRRASEFRSRSLTRKVSEILSNDPTVPLVLVDDTTQAEPI